MSNRSRRQLTRQFKGDAVRQVTDAGRRVSKVARAAGVTTGIRIRWVKEVKSAGEEPFVGAGDLTSLEKEIRRLRRENAQLKEKRAFLKKLRGLRCLRARKVPIFVRASRRRLRWADVQDFRNLADKTLQVGYPRCQLISETRGAFGL